MRVATTIWGRPFKVQVTAVLTDRDLDDGSGSPRPHFPGDPVSEESRDHTTPRRTILDVGKTGGANLDDIDALLYKPGSFVCPKCGFVLELRTISVSTGQIGIRKDGEHADPCPNDGETMNRVTWKDAYLDSADSGHELMLALIESVKLQSHYAELLNRHDAGKRATFSCPAEWIERLKQCGTIPQVIDERADISRPPR